MPSGSSRQMPVKPRCALCEAGRLCLRNLGLLACSAVCNAICEGRQKGTPTR